jgi:hypothetical protein
MIAPNSLTACCTSLLKHARAKPKHPRFHSDIMNNFLFDLARPDLALNGDYIYLLLAATALVFDATLTFCVFADTPNRYGKFSTPGAFVERACAYTVACALAPLRTVLAHPHGEGQSQPRAGDPHLAV